MSFEGQVNNAMRLVKLMHDRLKDADDAVKAIEEAFIDVLDRNAQLDAQAKTLRGQAPEPAAEPEPTAPSEDAPVEDAPGDSTDA